MPKNTFKVGNTPSPESGAPTGRDRETRRRMRSLALVLRDGWPPEQIMWWLREVIAGRDPDRPKPRDGRADQGAAPIEWPVRMRAAKMYLERALGQPAQSIHLEAEIKALGAGSGAVPSVDALSALAPEARDALRHNLRALLGAGATPPPPARSASQRAGGSGGGGAGGEWSAPDRDDDDGDEGEGGAPAVARLARPAS